MERGHLDEMASSLFFVFFVLRPDGAGRVVQLAREGEIEPFSQEVIGAIDLAARALGCVNSA